MLFFFWREALRWAAETPQGSRVELKFWQPGKARRDPHPQGEGVWVLVFFLVKFAKPLAGETPGSFSKSPSTTGMGCLFLLSFATSIHIGLILAGGVLSRFTV